MIYVTWHKQQPKEKEIQEQETGDEEYKRIERDKMRAY